MTAAAPSWFRRASIAISAVRRILKDPNLARTVAAALANDTGSRTDTAPHRPAAKAAILNRTNPDAALILLGLLQKEGRLVDFLHEDIQGYSDQEVGAAARVVHQGCRRVLTDHLTLTPIRAEPEGRGVTLEPGFDAAAIRPTGHLVGDPPFVGTLVHRGWRVTDIRLPQVASSHDPAILAAAEVEL